MLVEPPAVQTEPPPISYLYTHLHDSIRLELDNLGQAVLQLQQTGNSGSAGLGAELAALQNRYHFLEQVYKYHSSVEDEASAAAAAAARACTLRALPALRLPGSPHSAQAGAAGGAADPSARPRRVLPPHPRPAHARRPPPAAGGLPRPGLQSTQRHAGLLSRTRG